MSKTVLVGKNKTMMNKKKINKPVYQSIIDPLPKKTSYDVFNKFNIVENPNFRTEKNKTTNSSNSNSNSNQNICSNDVNSEFDTNKKTEELVLEDGWDVVKSKRKTKRDHVDLQNDDCKIIDSNDESMNLQDDAVVDNGSSLHFKRRYKIWVHDSGQNWNIDGFDNDFFIIDSVASFLQFFNNFYKFDLNTYSFYIMKELDDGSFIEPIWEHELNRNGSTCSLRIDMIHSLELLEQLCLLMANECLIPDMDLINGISIGKKTNGALIKIWVRDKDVDISKMLPYAIINSYPSLCVRSKANVPEY